MIEQEVSLGMVLHNTENTLMISEIRAGLLYKTIDGRYYNEHLGQQLIQVELLCLQDDNEQLIKLEYIVLRI